MYQAKIKYHYALNDKGKITDISDVTENDRRTKYYCLSCGDEMRPRLGVKNAHHFAHKSTTPDCNPETYLHKLAKYKIKEKFDSGIPFEISIRQTSGCIDKEHCPFHKADECRAEDYRTYDLRKNYDTCLEEQVIGDYRADLLLISSAKPDTPPILIEIFVTHKCEEEKIDSGEKIIEIQIKKEEDIANLLQSTITEPQEYSFDKSTIKCTFHNFKRTALDTKLEVRRIPKFYLFRNGSAYVSNMEDYPSCREAQRKDNPNAILELGIDVDAFPLGQPSPYELVYAIASEQGYIIKNCSLCKYRKDAFNSIMSVPNICCLYKKYDTPQYPKGPEAMNCSYFRKNQDNATQLKKVLAETPVVICK